MGLEDSLFNLKFVSKQFERSAKKSQKDEKTERLKVKKAIQQGNVDGARIYAQNAIRKKNEYLNYLRLASRVDAVASRMETAVKMNAVNKSMKEVVKSMDKVLSGMNVDQISKVMDKFEKQFDDLDVTSSYMENAMAQSSSITTPEDEVNSLMAEVADEYSLDLGVAMGSVPTSKKIDESTVQADELSARLAKLKSQKS